MEIKIIYLVIYPVLVVIVLCNHKYTSNSLWSQHLPLEIISVAQYDK